jgi:hypothetical protein
MIGSPGTLRHGTDDPFKTRGAEDLCTWRDPGNPGIAYFQTRCPELARKLSQRSKARLIRWSVGGGYLRAFAEPMQPWRARRLVTRTPNEAFGDATSSEGRWKRTGRLVVAGIRPGANGERIDKIAQ